MHLIYECKLIQLFWESFQERVTPTAGNHPSTWSRFNEYGASISPGDWNFLFIQRRGTALGQAFPHPSSHQSALTPQPEGQRPSLGMGSEFGLRPALGPISWLPMRVTLRTSCSGGCELGVSAQLPTSYFTQTTKELPDHNISGSRMTWMHESTNKYLDVSFPVPRQI